MIIWNTTREIINWLWKHSPTHEDGGVDEISLTGLSGDPADTINESLLTTQDDIIVRGASEAERLNIVEQRLVGRITSGHVVGLTAAQVATLIQASVDHGSIAGLGDDDHAQYILHSLADAPNDFLVASGDNTFARQTLAQTLATLSPLTTRGDIMFRNATVSTRLAKGAANTVLVMGTDDPAWSATLAGLTLTAPVINGEITTTGLTMPTFLVGNYDGIDYFGGSDADHDIATLQGVTGTPRFFWDESKDKWGFSKGLVVSGDFELLHGDSYTGRISGGGLRRIFWINASDQCEIGASNLPLVFESNASLVFPKQGFIDTGNIGVDDYYISFEEMTAPGAGAANTARLYAHLVDGGKTELCVIFQSGAVQVIATEP